MDRAAAGGFGENAAIFGSWLKMTFPVKALRLADSLNEVVSSHLANGLRFSGAPLQALVGQPCRTVMAVVR